MTRTKIIRENVEEEVELAGAQDWEGYPTRTESKMSQWLWQGMTDGRPRLAGGVTRS